MASDTAQHLSLYKGSCHCGFITYTAQLDFTTPKPSMQNAIMTKCNCSICLKSGIVLADPGPDGFTLLNPPEGMSEYTFNTNRLHHTFCPKCGIHCFITVPSTDKPNELRVLRVNVLTLDGKADGTPMDDLRNVKIKYWNGKYNFEGPPAEEPFEGGVW